MWILVRHLALALLVGALLWLILVAGIVLVTRVIQ
jgi:inner membrane protein involved in colicin E2 resistance